MTNAGNTSEPVVAHSLVTYELDAQKHLTPSNKGVRCKYLCEKLQLLH